MIFVSKTPSCPQDSNPPCTPWFFILMLARMVPDIFCATLPIAIRDFARSTHGDKPVFGIGDVEDVRRECALLYGCPAYAVRGIRHFAGSTSGDKPVFTIGD